MSSAIGICNTFTQFFLLPRSKVIHINIIQQSFIQNLS